MASDIKYQNDFIIGGNLNSSLTPNFQVKEFKRTGGKVYIHRELVAALQELREAYGKSIKVTGVDARGARGLNADGLFCWITSDDNAIVLAASVRLTKLGYFARVEESQGDIYLEMPPPDKLPALPPDFALETAIRITAAFETSGDPFQQVTGNFDKMGLSFGPLQFNFGTGTLTELMNRMVAADEPALKRCFITPAAYHEWMQVVHSSIPDQISWANKRSTGNNKSGFADPWKSYLQAVGRIETFRRVMIAQAFDVYGRKLIIALSWLKGLSPIRIDSFRCLCALYDLGVQQGSLVDETVAPIIRARVAAEKPVDQFALVRIAVEERGRTAKAKYRADCISRRLGILDRSPVTVTESGVQSTRDNARFYLLRNTSVTEVEKYLT